MSRTRKWNRSDAEESIVDVLDGAKAGAVQLIEDVGGTFELRFIKDSDAREPVGKFLARGGPLPNEEDH